MMILKLTLLALVVVGLAVFHVLNFQHKPFSDALVIFTSSVTGLFIGGYCVQLYHEIGREDQRPNQTKRILRRNR